MNGGNYIIIRIYNNRVLKIIISLILLLIWMILIFNFSAMDGSSSHAKSTKVVRSIVENKTILPTADVNENSVSADGQELSKNNEISINENAEKQKLNKENEAKINKMVSKYDMPVRKTAHVFEYFVLILLVMNFFFQVVEKRKARYYLVGMLFCVMYACLDEFHQSYVAGRTGKVTDVLIDIIGIGVGVFLVIVVQKILSNRRKKNE